MSCVLTPARRKLFEKATKFCVKVTNSKEGSGTGIVLDKRGYVLTAWHVLEGAANACSVRRFYLPQKGSKPKPTGRLFAADRIFFDNSLDIAVIKMRRPPKDLVVAELGDSNALTIGSSLYHVGIGITPHLVCGYLFELFERKGVKFFMVGLYTPDGSSGGPFVNTEGKVMGIEIEGSTDPLLADWESALLINQVKEVLLRQEDCPQLHEIVTG